jgi:general stress protein CsbA
MKLPSNKSFGLILAVLLLIISLYLHYIETNYFILKSSIVLLAFLLAAISLIKPKILYFLNRYWHKILIYIGDKLNFLLMFFVFFIFITPFSLIVKTLRGDYLRVNLDLIDTTWVESNPSNKFNELF